MAGRLQRLRRLRKGRCEACATTAANETSLLHGSLAPADCSVPTWGSTLELPKHSHSIAVLLSNVFERHIHHLSADRQSAAGKHGKEVQNLQARLNKLVGRAEVQRATCCAESSTFMPSHRQLTERLLAGKQEKEVQSRQAKPAGQSSNAQDALQDIGPAHRTPAAVS